MAFLEAVYVSLKGSQATKNAKPSHGDPKAIGDGLQLIELSISLTCCLETVSQQVTTMKSSLVYNTRNWGPGIPPEVSGPMGTLPSRPRSHYDIQRPGGKATLRMWDFQTWKHGIHGEIDPEFLWIDGSPGWPPSFVRGSSQENYATNSPRFPSDTYREWFCKWVKQTRINGNGSMGWATWKTQLNQPKWLDKAWATSTN